MAITWKILARYNDYVLSHLKTTTPLTHHQASFMPLKLGNNLKQRHDLHTHKLIIIRNDFQIQTEPSSYEEVVQHPNWQNAMNKELTTLKGNVTWSIVPLLKRKKAFGSKWFYKIKHDTNGTIERYKVHLWPKDITKYKGWTTMKHLP